MSTITKAAGAFATGLLLAATAHATPIGTGAPILAIEFPTRTVHQIEVGDFHFTPGQPAPIHTHDAPVYGYVSKGSIRYQVEGEAPKILKAGDAFYEPVGPRILHFDNASATEEAVFTDFNLERDGDPFIVFPTPPTAKIDRRALPTIPVEAGKVAGVTGYSETLKPAETRQAPTGDLPLTGYVASGEIEIRAAGAPVERVAAGRTFAVPAHRADAAIVNVAGDQPARVVTFVLR